MNNEKTELVFILDRSGSMGGLESDTIGGYNSVLNKQRDLPGQAIVTTVLFDDKIEFLHDRIPLEGVRPITNREYFVRGSTALLDAIGMAMQKIINVQRHTVEEEQAGKVMFVIITDGYENSSREFDASRIRKMIEYQKEKYHWEFLFIGANIDAIKTASDFGISPDRAQNYYSDKQGTNAVFSSVSQAARSMRKNGSVGAGWDSDIQCDNKSRRK